MVKKDKIKGNKCQIMRKSRDKIVKTLAKLKSLNLLKSRFRN